MPFGIASRRGKIEWGKVLHRNGERIIDTHASDPGPLDGNRRKFDAGFGIPASADQTNGQVAGFRQHERDFGAPGNLGVHPAHGVPLFPGDNLDRTCSHLVKTKLAGGIGFGFSGRAFLVQVPGTSQAALDNARIAELLNWMLVQFSAKEIPPGFEPYTTAEVGRYRSAPLDDVAARRKSVADRLKQMGNPVD